MADIAEPRAVARPWRRVLPNGKQAVIILLIAVIGFYVLYPLSLTFLNSFNTASIDEPPVYSLGPWMDAFNTRDILSSLRNSLLVALWYQAFSFPIGVMLAWTLGRTNIPGGRWLEFGFWLSFFMPSLSTTLGWILLLDPHDGIINQIIAKILGAANGPFDIYSFTGIVWVHMMATAISAKVMLLTPAFRSMDASLEEASHMSGGNRWRTLFRISLPIMTPALVIVFLISFVRLFESFEIELLLGVPIGFYVFSTKILDLTRQVPPMYGQATALGSLTLLLLLAAIPLQRWLTMRRSYTTVSGRIKAKPIDLGRWRWPVFALVAFIAALLLIVPLFSIIAGSFMTRFGYFNLPHPWTLEHWQHMLSSPEFIQALFNTLEIAGFAGVAGPIIFSVIAYTLVRVNHVWGRGILDGLLWLPSVVPGILTGLGLLWMFVGTTVFQPLFGTIWVLIIAGVMGGMTLSTQILKSAFLQIHKDLEEGARMAGAGWFRTYFRIVLPLIAPTLVVVAAINFMLAANATSSFILLATSDTRTLSLMVLDAVSVGERENATVIVVVIVALTSSMAILARALGYRVGMQSSR